MLALVVALILYAQTGPMDLIDQAEQLNCISSDDACLQAEFTLRKQADQGVRLASNADLGCSASDMDCVSAAWRQVDTKNQDRLETIIDARGWPPLEGEAAQGAWLIAQHFSAVPDTPQRAFRDRVLPMVLNEVKAKRLEAQDYARMIDRNALADGQSQPYGTNRPCKDGRYDRSSIDSVEAVDDRRRNIGMDIMLSEALSYYDQLCDRDQKNAKP